MTLSMKKLKLKPLEIGPHVKRTIALVAAHSERKEHDTAVALARELREAFPKRADVNDALSLALVDKGSAREALQPAEVAVSLEPANAAYLINLGRLLLDLREPERALPFLERASASKLFRVEAEWALARYFVEIGQARLASQHFEVALANADEQQRGDLLWDYLDTLQSVGELEAAEAVAEELGQTGDIRSDVSLARMRNTRIESELGQRILNKVAQPGLSDAVLRRVLNQIGRMYENSQQFGTAFDFYTRAKATVKDQFSDSDFEKDVENMMRAYSAERLAEFGSVGHPSDRPVFVVGMPRSGTTMTEQIIGAHPRAQGIGEQSRIGELASRLSPQGDPGKVFRMLETNSGSGFLKVPESYLGLADCLAPGADRVVDKMPHNFMFVGFIALCFPNARFVHVHRNPLDNFVSAFQNDMNTFHSYSYDQEVYARYYIAYSRLMDHWNKVLPGRILNWRYEDAVTDPTVKIAELLKFLDLEWDDRCLNFHTAGAPVRTFSQYQVRNPISAKSVDRWKNYAEQLAPMRKILML